MEFTAAIEDGGPFQRSSRPLRLVSNSPKDVVFIVDLDSGAVGPLIIPPRYGGPGSRSDDPLPSAVLPRPDDNPRVVNR